MKKKLFSIVVLLSFVPVCVNASVQEERRVSPRSNPNKFYENFLLADDGDQEGSERLKAFFKKKKKRFNNPELEENLVEGVSALGVTQVMKKHNNIQGRDMRIEMLNRGKLGGAHGDNIQVGTTKK